MLFSSDLRPLNHGVRVGSPLHARAHSWANRFQQPAHLKVLLVRTFLKVYMELGSYFLFLQEQIKDIIIIKRPHLLCAAAAAMLSESRPIFTTYRRFKLNW